MEDSDKLEKKLRATSRKTAREQARADALFLSIGEGAIATNSEGKVQQINQAALDLLGYKKEEVIGQWFPRVIVAQDNHGQVISALNRPITKALLTGKPVSERINYLTKKEGALPVSVTVSPIVLDSRPIGAIEVFRDVTKENEVDRMKSEFISIASHQLRTPLTSINTYAHLLASGYQGKLTKGQQQFMKIIFNSIDRMSDLINILLDTTRIEAGKIDITLKETDITELIKSLGQELQPQAKAKDIKIKLDLPRKTVKAIIDQVLTTEVLTNLLSNAIKYTPEKGKIQIALKETKHELLISVSDTGYGISAADRGKIFTKFFRTDNAKQAEPTGTGLGLYMSKEVVDSMGGKIWFESNKDQGTTFYLSLPIRTH